MSKRLIRIAVGLLAGVSANVVVCAQDTGEVVVQAQRVVRKTIGQTATGVAIQDISLSYGVSTTGLDLTSSAGAAELQKRVATAAKEACKELARQAPHSTTTDAECVKNATDKAMVKANELIAAKKSGK